jgi:hypothetical protein
MAIFISVPNAIAPLLANVDNSAAVVPTQINAGRIDIRGKSGMLWTLFIILLTLWLVGVVSSFTLDGFVHILLVLAVVALVFQLLMARHPV